MARRTLTPFACLTVCFLCLLAVLPAAAADAISGTVLDASGAPLPRAPVELRHPAHNLVARTLTDSQGRFRFEGLAAEAYTLSVELIGFEPHTQAVRPGEILEIKLALAPVRERVVVTATRTEVPTGQVGSSVTVIPPEWLETRQSLTLTELLRVVPSLAPVQSGPPGAITSVFARGGESDHNKVLIDGVPVNEPGGFFSFSNLTPLNLSRVEVVRGPQSALFGSDALGSVIQLFTRRAPPETPRPRLALAVEGGKHATRRASPQLMGTFNRFDYSLAGSRFLTDNATANAAFRNTTLSGNLGAALGERTSLRAVLRGDFGTAGTPGQTAYHSPDNGAFFRRREGVLNTILQNQTTRLWQQRLSYGYARSRQRSRDEVNDTSATFFDFLFDFLNDTRRHRLNYQSDFTFAPTQIFTTAFEYEREKGHLATVFLEFPGFSPPPVLAHRTNLGFIFQHQAVFDQMPLGPLSLTGGVRVEENGSFGTEATPRVSAAWLVRRGGETFGASKLKFNFGTGIKEPSFVESFSTSPFFCGNPNLKPERVRSFDAGLEQRLARDRAKFELNLFHNRFRDLVSFGPSDPDPSDSLTCFSSFFNLGRAKAKGGEIVLEVSPRAGLHVTGSYTYVNSQVVETLASLQDDPVFGVGRPLLRRPRHAGAVVVQWDWRWLNLTSSLVAVGRRVDSDFFAAPQPQTSNPGYTKWDAAAHFRPARLGGERLAYFFVVENLLNRRYMEALGFPALKLTARGGVRIDF